MHKAADSIRLGHIAWNISAIESSQCGTTAADPNREHRLRGDAFLTMRFDDGNDRFCGVGCRRKRGRYVHDQNCVVFFILEQLVEGDGVSGAIGIARDVDRNSIATR